jgi:GNAT acetyltransferase-like protein
MHVIPATSPEWADRLAAVPHDFYHTAEYHLFSQTCGEGEAFLAVYGDRAKFVAWPYLLRQVSDSVGLEGSTFTDVTSVYGYPGPIVCNAVDDGVFLTLAWEAFVDLWRQQRVVTVFTRFHPVLANHQWLSRFCPPRPMTSGENPDLPEAGLVLSGQTVSIDLTLSDSENLRQYQKVLRQEIARSRRLGLVTATDDNWTNFEDFLTLYQCTMSRNHAASQYFFSADYFQRLRKALWPHVHLIVTKLNDQVAAAGIFVEYGGIVQAHLAGSSEELKALSPLKVLLDDVRRWAQQRGNQVFHMGGGRAGRDDSLWTFKAKFSPRWHPFYLGRWILERDAYVSLCEQRRVYAQEAGLVWHGEDFFPQYRTPIEKSPGAWSASNGA